MNGGKRPGAGRKPGRPNSKRTELMKLAGEDLSAKTLSEIDVIGAWKRLLNCASPRVVAATLMYLHDRTFGRPTQMLQANLQQHVTINLNWSTAPEWAQPHEPEPVPVSNRLAIPIESLLSDSSENKNDN